MVTLYKWCDGILRGSRHSRSMSSDPRALQSQEIFFPIISSTLLDSKRGIMYGSHSSANLWLMSLSSTMLLFSFFFSFSVLSILQYICFISTTFMGLDISFSFNAFPWLYDGSIGKALIQDKPQWQLKGFPPKYRAFNIVRLCKTSFSIANRLLRDRSRASSYNGKNVRR